MLTYVRSFKVIGFIFLLFIVSACGRYPVKHLASDISLIVPGQTTKKEVMSFMGMPENKMVGQNGEETWYYYQANKSLLRKTPYIGGTMGYEEYDVVVITFSGDLVSDSKYRLLSEEEFSQSGLKTGEEQ